MNKRVIEEERDRPVATKRASIGRAAIKGLFAFDFVVALAPPLYWIADGVAAPILGLPAALFYFLAVSTCIAASLIAAYWLDGSTQEIAA